MEDRPRRYGLRPVALSLCGALAWPPAAAGATEPAPSTEDRPERTPADDPSDAEPEPEPESESPPNSEPSSSPDEAPAADGSLTPERIAERDLAFDRNEAKRHFIEGQRLHEARRYAEAAVEFARSYAAVPIPNTLYNVALSYEMAGKSVEAVRALERYLALPECHALAPELYTDNCKAQRDAARTALEEQRRRIGALTIKLADGVELREVRVAGRTVPQEDFPIWMLPGTVDVELFGMGPDDRRTRPAYITAGEAYEVYVAPFETAVQTRPPVVELNPRPSDPLRQQQRRRRLKIAFWSGVGLTAASGIAVGITGGLTRYHFRRYGLEKCAPECYQVDASGEFIRDSSDDPIPLNTGYPEDHERAFERFRPITNALVGVTIGLGVSTALVGIFAFRPRGKASSGRSRSRRRVQVRPAAPGVVVRW